MGKLTTVLGKDVLVLQRFEGTDRMSGLFDYRVACLTETENVNFDDLLGTHATVTLKGHDGTDRHFDGIVTESRWLGSGDNGMKYEIRLQPWFWLATLKRNQRIFHEKTVIEILQELLGAYGNAGNLVVNTTATYPTLEYTVQYRESDFNFACRLMERHGISYHFKPSEGAHDMVLTDSIESHDMLGAFPVKPYVGHHQEDVEHLWQWHPARRMTTGAMRMTDYNFKTPTVVMEKDQTGSAAYENGQIESFDWPGDYLDPGRGGEMVQLGLKRDQARDARFEAVGDISNLVAGQRITISGDSDEVPGKGDEFLCIVSSHSYTSDNYGSGGTAGDGFAYTGRYVFIPASAPMVPEKKTSHSDVRGPMTAAVVGAEGEEIDCDEHGRILVKFHWDLNSAHSMRCRVAQNWSGGGWGGMIIPRIGMEVLVEFLEGDPDKPLVTGCVYNGKNMAAYPLPANKTKAVFRTDSHKASGFNELVFEDEPGQENIAFKAQQDMSRLVLQDSISRVKRHEIDSVGVNKTVEVGNNFKMDVGGSVNMTAGGTGPAAKDLLSGLSGLMGESKSLLKKGATLGGGSSGGDLGKFAGTIGSKDLGFISGDGVSGRRGMHGADETGSDANHKLREDGTKVGASAASLFKSPGVMNLYASNFRSDTTGVAAVENVGLTKTLHIGGSLMEKVGKAIKSVVGKTYELTVGTSILTQTKKHTMVATQKVTIASPGASIEMDSAGITIKAFKVKVLSPSVDFNPGAPSQAAVLQAVQAFGEDCQGTAG
ncbi:type VI secretion system Vgr family protein [Sagittula sp. S175]|uniref:type VI secretion system Vgr family protein n=1 Tax=Sagittula sp. S175 TaxID=3415129 RepID=UPI003C7C4F23